VKIFLKKIFEKRVSREGIVGVEVFEKNLESTAGDRDVISKLPSE